MASNRSKSSIQKNNDNDIKCIIQQKGSGSNFLLFLIVLGAVLVYIVVTIYILSSGQHEEDILRQQNNFAFDVGGDDLLGGAAADAGKTAKHNLESIMLEGLAPLKKPKPLNYGVLNNENGNNLRIRDAPLD